MYICNCNGLNPEAIEFAIDSGADTVKKIYAHHGCSKKCGKCIPEIKDILAENGIEDKTIYEGEVPQSTCHSIGCTVTSSAVRNPAHDISERSC